MYAPFTRHFHIAVCGNKLFSDSDIVLKHNYRPIMLVRLVKLPAHMPLHLYKSPRGRKSDKCPQVMSLEAALVEDYKFEK